MAQPFDGHSGRGGGNSIDAILYDIELVAEGEHARGYRQK
jgi:hypothetical protein